MSKLNKIISQLSRSESFINEDVNMELSVNKTIDIFDSIPTVKAKMGFPASQFPVAMFENADPFKYGVSAEILGIFMDRNNINSIEEALDVIGGANDISGKEIGIVFESKDVLTQMIDEAKAEKEIAKREAKIKSVERVGYLIQNMKNGKIEVAKEPSVVQIDYNDKNLESIDTTKPFGDGEIDTNKDIFRNVPLA